MKLYRKQSPNALITRFHLFFTPRFLKESWAQCEPRKYPRKIQGPALVLAVMEAMVRRLAGVRNIARHCSRKLGTNNFTSLTHAFRRQSGVKLLSLLIHSLQSRSGYHKGELVAIDSMAVTFGKTRRHRCKDFNNHAAGGGALWSYRIKAKAGTCPARLIKLMRGAWHDSRLMQGVELEPDGPIYLMDRGFYCINLLRTWLDKKVRFIVRVRTQLLCYKVARHLSRPRTSDGGWRIELDAIVLLGADHRGESRPKIRLIIAKFKGETFAYATSETGSCAEQIIANYKQRWHIERFHRFLKNNLGLGHIYSYDATGLEFMILAALLSAMLLFTVPRSSKSSDTLSVLQYALTRIRRQLNMEAPWKRNILAVKRSSGKHLPHKPT